MATVGAMVSTVSTLDALLAEVQNKANNQVDELLNKLLMRVLYPPVTKDPVGCPKHNHALHIYREIACLRTKYRRMLYRNLIPAHQADVIEGRYSEARLAFRLASCNCLTSNTSIHDICCECKETVNSKNGCRHPVHLAVKKGETYTKPLRSIDIPVVFDVGGGV